MFIFHSFTCQLFITFSLLFLLFYEILVFLLFLSLVKPDCGCLCLSLCIFSINTLRSVRLHIFEPLRTLSFNYSLPDRSSETTSELPTTEEAFTSEIVSTDLSTTDIPSPETTVTDATPMCECKCTNITLEEVYEQVEEVKKELTVDKKLLSKEKRKRATMEDTRPTSTGVGYVGSALLIIIFGSIMVIDLISAGRYILGRINEKHKVKQTCNGVGVAYRRKHLIHVQPEGIVLHMTDRTDYRLEVFARRRPAPVQS